MSTPPFNNLPIPTTSASELALQITQAVTKTDADRQAVEQAATQVAEDKLAAQTAKDLAEEAAQAAEDSADRVDLGALDQAVSDAAGSAGAAAASAAIAGGKVIDAEAARDGAVAAKAAAEVARDAAITNADVYPSSSAGIAATSSGEQFQVIEDDEIVRYLNDSGLAVEVARYPTKNFLPQGTFLYHNANLPVPGSWFDLGPIATLMGGTAMRLITNYREWWSIQAFQLSPMVSLYNPFTGTGETVADVRSICWNHNGTRIYHVSRGTNAVHQFDAAVPYSVANGNLSYAGKHPNLASGVAHGIRWRPDGLVVYIHQRSTLRAHAVSTPWDVTTADGTAFATLDVTANGASRAHGIDFKPDGTMLYVDDRTDPGFDPPAVYQYALSTPWDITTAVNIGTYYIPRNVHSAVRGNQLSPDGQRMFLYMVGEYTLWEFKLETPWMVETAKPAAALTLTGIAGFTVGTANSVYGFIISPNGRDVVVSQTGGSVAQIKILPRLKDYGPLTTQAQWVYNIASGGTTVQVNLSGSRPANWNFIDWGDGGDPEELLSDGGGSTAYPHTYADAGEYTVTLVGGATGLSIAPTAAAKSALTKILDFGSGMGWRSFASLANECPNLVEVPANFPASVSACGDSGTNGAFRLSPQVAHPNMADWDLRGVTGAYGMLQNTGTYNFPVNWEMPIARNTRNMLGNSTFNQRLDNFGFHNASDVRSMFGASSGFDNDSPKNWDWRNVTQASGIFPTLSTANYDAILIGIAAWGSELQSGVGLGATSSKYSPAAADARDYLVTVKGWTITDGGPE